MKAEHHPDNSRRLEILRSYGVLDTERERDFDDVVSLASKLCETPVSLISLVDENRQWMKAAIGVNWTETPMEQAICTVLPPASKGLPMASSMRCLSIAFSSVVVDGSAAASVRGSAGRTRR